MPKGWKGALLRDGETQGYKVVCDQTDCLYVEGVPYTKDEGERSTFNLKIPRKNGGDEGESHQAWVEGWDGKTVQTPSGPIPQSAGWQHMSLKRSSTQGYDDIYDQAVFYVQKLGEEGGAWARSPEEDWRRQVEGIRIAVVGAGGTGMHLIDILSKTSVRSIEVWDEDVIEVRNTWRWPGGQERWKNLEGQKKARGAGEEYSNGRTTVNPHDEMVTKENMDTVTEADYVFVAVDCREARNMIINACIAKGTPCIDVGMGVEVREGKLKGSVRVHIYRDTANEAYTTPEIEGAQQAYEATEVPEANALNAALAVTEWRRIAGQYEVHKEARGTVQYNLDWACLTVE